MTRTDHRPASRPASGGLGFLADDRGAVSIVAASVLVVVIAVSAIVVDAGSLLLARRTLQTATDAAALSAAQNLDTAQSAATTVLVENGYTASNLAGAPMTGIYDRGGAPGSRFSPSADLNDPRLNAVSVSTLATAPMYFSRALGMSALADIHATATATVSPVASFQAGTRVAQLQDGLANALLGALFGTNLSLSAIDYDGLLDTDINALGFFNALATRVGLSSTSTYGDLLDADVTVGQILDASLDVLQNPDGGASGNIAAATSAIQTLISQAPGGTALKLASVLHAPSLLDRAIGSRSVNSPALNLYGIVVSTARSAGAGTIANLDTGITIPLTGSHVRVRLAIGEGKQMATGPVGTSIDTAQIRLAIDLGLADTSVSALLSTLTATNIELPIYIAAAPGTATIKAIPCESDRMATLTGISGASEIRFGTVTDAALSDFASPPVPSPATIASVTLLGLPVAQINASGAASIVSHGPEDLDFSADDVDAGTVRSVPVGNDSQFISSNGPGALQTSATLLGSVSSSLLNALLSAVTSQLISALSLLDAPVASLLTALGISLGALDMSVTDVKCGVPTLVS